MPRDSKIRKRFYFLDSEYISKFFKYEDLEVTSKQTNKKMLPRASRERKSISEDRLLYDKLQ